MNFYFLIYYYSFLLIIYNSNLSTNNIEAIPESLANLQNLKIM